MLMGIELIYIVTDLHLCCTFLLERSRALCRASAKQARLSICLLGRQVGFSKIFTNCLAFLSLG